MSDRYIALTVFLEHPTKDEDAQATIDAIKQLRGIFDVQPVIADPGIEWAKATARSELGKELIKLVYPDF